MLKHRDGNWCGLVGELKDLEVIGNICENKELLQ